jgi:hypothetical protein
MFRLRVAHSNEGYSVHLHFDINTGCVFCFGGSTVMHVMWIVGQYFLRSGHRKGSGALFIIRIKILKYIFDDILLQYVALSYMVGTMGMQIVHGQLLLSTYSTSFSRFREARQQRSYDEHFES